MKRFIATYLLGIFVSLTAVAQVSVSGTVIDKPENEPLAGASVIVRGADGKIRKFATTKADGAFALSLPSVGGCRMEVSMMGFARQTFALDSVSLPLTVYMEPGTIELKEVAVKAERIREQGDTITYGVSTFAQAQDRSIGDVLKRMPGINVEKSGKIQYQGEDINKFYIEGSDLLGGKYGIATNGINHEDVGAVEVMENHQPMQVLAGLSFSDKAAINLKLKNKAKATWTLHGSVGGGYSWQPGGAVWDSEVFAMAVMPSFQNITTFKTNNIGEDLSRQTTDFFASRRGTELSQYVGVSLPGVPALSRKRTLFNRSVLVSTNNLWKFGRGEFKAQVDYSFNRVTANADNVTTYFLTGAASSGDNSAEGGRVVTENRSGVDRSHSLAGKFIYELNRKTAYINNTLTAGVDWDDIRLGIIGSLTNTQSASLPDYYVGNKFKMIKRFNGAGGKTHLVTFNSVNEWESQPQTLTVAMDSGSGASMRQHIGDHAFLTHESAAYAFSLKGVTVSLEGGLKAYVRSMNSEFQESDAPERSDVPDDSGTAFTNVVNTNYFTLYASPRFEYWVRRVNFTLTAPLSLTRYTFDKALADRSEGYFSPSLSMNWKPNNRLSLTLRGKLGRSPMNLNLIQPSFIMTDYRSLRRGVDDFYSSSSRSLSFNGSYRHTRSGLFANAMVIQSWSHLPYTLSQQLYGDYIVYSYTSAKSDSKNFIANGSLGKTLDFMRGSVNLNGSFNRSESHLLSEGRGVNSVGLSWLAGARVSGAVARWLSVDYKFSLSSSRLTMNDVKASWLESMENEMLINIMPSRKWEWHIIGEHYRNELEADNFKNVFLLDTKLVFKPGRRIEFSARLSNIFNERTYDYKTYNQLSSFESRRYLRGRELLISIILRK